MVTLSINWADAENTMMHVTFTTPRGEVIHNPDEAWVAAIIETAGANYWDVGSGDACLRYEADGLTFSEMILVVRDTYGVLVYHLFTSDGIEHVACGPDSENAEVTIRHGGNPWTLPRVFFVSRAEATEAVKYFLRCGGRSPNNTWAVF